MKQDLGLDFVKSVTNQHRDNTPDLGGHVCINSRFSVAFQRATQLESIRATPFTLDKVKPAYSGFTSPD
jgi:hypothetical protein